MFTKGVFKLYLNTNLYSNRLSFSSLKSFKYGNSFFFRNEHSSANFVSESEEEDNIIPKSLSSRYGFNYILENNNFRHPVRDIIDLKFTIDDKHESLKLLNRLKGDLENERLWQEALDCFKKESNKFDLEDLLKASALTAYLLKATATNEVQVLQNLINSLDMEIKHRILPVNDILEILFVVKHSFCLRKKLTSFYFYLKFLRLLTRLHKYQPPEVLHFFYYFEALENNSSAVRYSVFKYLTENAVKLNDYELGIILSALVRNRMYSGQRSVLELLTERVSQNIESADSNFLYNTSKFFLGSSSISNFQIIKKFQDSLVPHTSKFTTNSLIMSLLSDYPFYLNLSLWEKTLEKIKADIKSLSIVNIERVAKITTMFKVDDKNFLKLAVEAVEEMETAEVNFSHLINFCKHLVIHRIYSEKLLNIIFSKDFIDRMLSRKFSRQMNEWYFIHYTLKIDKPEYQCTNLDEISEKKIIKECHVVTPLGKFLLGERKISLRLFEVLKSFYGENKVMRMLCHPNFIKGMIMTFDKNLEALPIPEEYKNSPKGVVAKPADDNIWICMNTCYILEEGLNPLQETYKRHLCAMGYVPVLVPDNKLYRDKDRNYEITKDYIQNIIEKAVEENFQKEKMKVNSWP